MKDSGIFTCFGYGTLIISIISTLIGLDLGCFWLCPLVLFTGAAIMLKIENHEEKMGQWLRSIGLAQSDLDWDMIKLEDALKALKRRRRK